MSPAEQEVERLRVLNRALVDSNVDETDLLRAQQKAVTTKGAIEEMRISQEVVRQNTFNEAQRA